MSNTPYPNGALYRLREEAHHALQECTLGTERYVDTARILEMIDNMIEKRERWERAHLKVTAQTEFNRAKLNGCYSHKELGDD